MGNAREICRTGSDTSPAEPPALPPRPTVDAAAASPSLMEHRDAGSGGCSPCSKKYVLLCAACGGLAIILGSLFAVLYVILRSYTSSLHYFETVPSYVAAVSLIVTGLLMLCFGWRRNRFGYLVKLCGACCLLCAVVCVVITVTTTVVHMNRLQTLRECVYNARGRSCTCFTGSSVVAGHHQTLSAAQQQAAAAGLLAVVDPALDQGSARYIFADTPDCEVVHGALYACLRALFGLSVIGILVSLFSGMLVYQLLGHERKKMYWEQLELRSRALIRRHHPAPCCGCCQDCRFAPSSNNPMLVWPAWDVLDDSRYWGLHGGNLYSPGPCANGPTAAGSGGASAACAGQGHGTSPGGCPAHRRSSASAAWNWLPWRPAVSDSSDIGSTNRARRTESETGPVIIGPDDHYGFPLSNNNSNYRSPLALTAGSAGVQERVPNVATVAGWGPPPPYSRGSTSELGSISASTPMGSLSPAHRSPQSVKTGASSSPSTAGSATCLSKDNSLRKDHPLFASNSLLPRQQSKSTLQQPSPVARMNVDPRRMPWSAQTAGITNSFSPTRSVPGTSQTGSPSGRVDATNGKVMNESELYFGDTSSYTVSINNDGSNSSTMYEEIHGHRYDKIQRPVAKVTSIRSSVGGKPSQRSSWDGHNQRPPVGVHAAPGGQPRSRHSADTVGKEKMFSPIILPKLNKTPSQQANWLPAGQSDMIADTCSFVPYRRAAVVPSTGANDSRFPNGAEVYENVTNLDFDDKKPRTLSPDEEVAILTSQFHGSMPPVEQETESTQMDSESDDNDSVMRAVNV